MAEVVVVAVMKAREGAEAEVEEGLRQAAAQTHKEEGCIRYALHRSPDEPGRFALIERWRSREDLDTHFTMPHVRQLGEKAALLAEHPQVHFLEAVPAGDEEKGRL